MDINEAIARHPNLLNNYRRAAMCLVQADKMRERNEFNETRENPKTETTELTLPPQN